MGKKSKKFRNGSAISGMALTQVLPLETAIVLSGPGVFFPQSKENRHSSNGGTNGQPA